MMTAVTIPVTPVTQVPKSPLQSRDCLPLYYATQALMRARDRRAGEPAITEHQGRD